MGIAAVGAVYAARVLGPEKLGISTYVFGLVTLGGMLAELNINNELVRRGRHPHSGETLDDLVSQVFTFRLVVSLLCALAGILAFLILRPGAEWLLASAAGAVLVVFQGNQAGWLLQLRKNMPRYFAALSVQGIVTGLLMVALIRGSWPAGSDLAIGVIGTGLACYLMWKWALPPGCKIRLSKANFFHGAQLLHGAKWLVLMGLGLYVLNSAEILLIGSLAGVEDLGQYRAAMQLIGVLTPFVPLFFHSLYPRLIDLQTHTPSMVAAEQWAAVRKVFVFGLPSVVLGFLMAPLFYPFVFGAAFAPAATPLCLLFTAKVVSIAANVFLWSALARRFDREVVLWTLGIAAISLSMNILLIPLAGIVAAAAIGCGAQVLLLAAYMHVSAHRDKSASSQAPVS